MSQHVKKKKMFPDFLQQKNISGMKCKFSPALCMILTSNTLLCTGWRGTSLCVLPLRWLYLHLSRVIVQLKLHLICIKSCILHLKTNKPQYGQSWLDSIYLPFFWASLLTYYPCNNMQPWTCFVSPPMLYLKGSCWRHSHPSSIKTTWREEVKL